MKALVRCYLMLALAGALLGSATAASEAPPRADGASVLALQVEGIISPASAEFIRNGLGRAAQAGAQLVVVELDTPGGLDTSMRQIVKDILASPVPVATFVHPEGARAASAGTYILYASHIAAMSPATNLGAATPVAIGMAPKTPGAEKEAQKASDESGESETPTPSLGGDTLARKAVNDATAYIRGLAERRGRNVDFAERSVRESASIAAEEALAEGVIDVIASDLPDLLAQIDGRTVTLAGSERTLTTADARVERVQPDWRQRTLAVLANPQLALVLMMIGIYGLFFEFTSPGFGVPGVAGAICLMLALYALQMLPVNWAGVALVALGATLILAEAFLPSFGVLGIGGIIAFVLGGLFLIDSDLPALGVPLPFLAAMTALSAAAIFAIGTFAARSRARKLVAGRETLPGSIGTVTTTDEDGSWAIVEGESWRVRSANPLWPGEEVEVCSVDGLVLEVKPRP